MTLSYRFIGQALRCERSGGYAPFNVQTIDRPGVRYFIDIDRGFFEVSGQQDRTVASRARVIPLYTAFERVANVSAAVPSAGRHPEMVPSSLAKINKSP